MELPLAEAVPEPHLSPLERAGRFLERYVRESLASISKEAELQGVSYKTLVKRLHALAQHSLQSQSKLLQGVLNYVEAAVRAETLEVLP